MNTIKTFIPADNVESFKKFANKTKKNVEGFSFVIGKPYMKVFYHPVINENGMRGKCIKAFHEICDLTVNMPEENGWKLVCTFKDGAFTPVDTSKELIFKNPAHGQDYNKCDVCGHWCKNSYVIENVTTGEELQVGCECVKKFGIKSFDYLSKFTDELYKLYDYSLSCSTEDDELKMWGGNPNAIYKNAFKKADLIMSAKATYDKCPIYKKAYRQGNTHYPSPTLVDIEATLCGENFDINNEYVEKVCAYALSKPIDGEFAKKTHRLANDFYAYIDEAVYAFFMVKNYEDSLKTETKLETGTHVKVEGKVIQTRTEESYYGPMMINIILTDNGIECERIGKIPMTETDNIKRTSFYSTVKGIYHGKVSLDRTTKNPKKGVQYINI
jgi:hypothetical protein